MENQNQITSAPTFESVWTALMENRELMKETDRLMKETDRKMQDTDRRMKKLQTLVGSWTNNHGLFAEEYFINSFKKKQTLFFGEEFQEIRSPLYLNNGHLEDEYDIVMYNHKAIAIVEVKYKAHTNDIPTVIKKAETFRTLSPDYKNYKIYLGLASMSFYPELEQECIEQGIAVIKQAGDTVVINDIHLKTF